MAMSYTVDSASEDEMADDLHAFPTPDSNTENKAPARKGGKAAVKAARPAPATKALTQGKKATRRTSGDSVLAVNKQSAAAAKKPGAKVGRKVLAELNNNASDTEEVEEFGEEDEDEDEMTAPIEKMKPAKRGRPAKVKKEEAVAEVPLPTKKMRKVVEKEPASKPASKAKAAANSKAAKRAPEPEPEPEEIPETQPDADPMDVEDSIEIDEIPDSMPPPPPRPSARRNQQQPRNARQMSAPRRAGSMSDSERDPALRRRVGEITKKLEAMTTKYEALKDVASSSKESSFEQLKRKTDQFAKGMHIHTSKRSRLTISIDQDAVIKALKQQLSDLQTTSTNLSSVQKELATLKSANTTLENENKKLTTSLTTAQNENKALSSKLAAARSAPSEQKNVPGSAVKARTPGVVLPGAAEAAKDAQIKMAKVDLYSDLTNLVIVGIKKNEDGEEVYDCLQTGRNGSEFFRASPPTFPFL
jgi:regulator of replication initiation timing